MNKYIVLLGDGMADEPIDILDHKTPLQVAKTPAMDEIVQRGIAGMVHTVPEGLSPGSDVANMGILGYDPRIYYTGRGPIEAASLEVPIGEKEIVFRCNLTTVEDHVMSDFTAGHINNGDSKQLIDALNEACCDRGAVFYHGVSYRHILKVSEKFQGLECVAPHDILDQVIDSYLPKGSAQSEFLDLIHFCNDIIANHPLTKERSIRQDKSANFIWPWSPGKYPSFDSFKYKTGLSGGIVTAVDLLKGLAKLSGLKAPFVEGATGFLDTHYENKFDAGVNLLESQDFIYMHIEAPDEAGHMGDAMLKIQAIEDFDARIVRRFIDYADASDDHVHLLVLPDHPTPCHLKTHTSNPVPFGMYWRGIESDSFGAYDEIGIAKASKRFEYPWEMMKYFLSQNINE